MLRLAAVVLALLFAPPAFAIARVASDGNVTISELEILVEPEAWIVRARLDGRARRVALLFPLPGESAQVAGSELLDELDHRTSPRLRVASAVDPCEEAAPAEPSSSWPARTTPVPVGFEAAVLSPSAGIEGRLGGASLDPEAARELGARSLVALFGPAPGKLRGFWTPAVRIELKERSIPIGVAAPVVTFGKDLRIDLYARGSLAPAGGTADLATRIHLPEIAHDDPIDAFRAVTAQTIRREGRGTAVRIFSGDVQRWYLQVGRADELAAIELGERPLLPFRVEWRIRRAWRGPIRCPAKDRYLANVRIQQKNEIQTYAAMTGRPQSSIEQLMRERGYLQR